MFPLIPCDILSCRYKDFVPISLHWPLCSLIKRPGQIVDTDADREGLCA